MSNAMSIALSGMNASMLRLDAAASNIANAGVTGALPGASATKSAYAPVSVESRTLAGPSGTGGTEARVRPVMPAYVPSYEPGASYADANGLVAAPNVNPVEELANLEEASLAFRMNLMAFKTAAEMIRSLYDDVKSD